MFSVVITTHNRQREVERAVASAAAQSELPAEILVVDDASTPAVTLKSLEAMAGGIDIRLVRHEIPQGPAGARNAGIRLARSAWIAFLDDDDQFLTNKLERCRAMINMHPELDVLYHAACIDMVNEAASYTTRLTRERDDKTPLYRRLLVRNIVGGTPMVVARSAALKRVGGFDASLAALEDYELWLRLAREGAHFLALDEALTRCDYVTQRRSVTKSSAAGQDTFEQIRSRYQTDFDILSASEKHANGQWIREIELHRALLRLDRRQTLLKAWQLAIFAPSLKTAVAALLSLLGPRLILRLRAKLG